MGNTKTANLYVQLFMDLNMVNKYRYLCIFSLLILGISGCVEINNCTFSESDKIGSSDLINININNKNFSIDNFEIISNAEKDDDRIIISGNVTNNGEKIDSLCIEVTFHKKNGDDIYSSWVEKGDVFKNPENMNNSLFFDTAGTQEFEIELNKKLSIYSKYGDIKKYNINNTSKK